MLSLRTATLSLATAAARVSRKRAIQPSQLRTMSASLHKLPELPYDLNKGVGNFFSAKALDTQYTKHQKQLVDELNMLIEDTRYEQDMDIDIIRKCANQPDDARIFNAASQAYNNKFFLSTLTPTPVKMPEQLEQRIVDTWGSIENFKTDFAYSAIGIFGCGWTWLVEDELNNLLIVNTYNAGTTQLLSRLQSVDSNTLPTSRTLGRSDPHFPGLTRPLQNEVVMRKVPMLTYNHLLCLNMWQHAYMDDYGLTGRLQYINNFWDAVDWTEVTSRQTRKM